MLTWLLFGVGLLAFALGWVACWALSPGSEE